ncbi:hypothetical protein PoB_002268400 [Plakobranchus ocellatus]|uniref:Uncharacterized protein n=1 Tax=Plakobranchus ocellatus TaxID=259542 RepID=A0AAV3ZLJ3_9GAST|nr:hypothetical protein PoB_002268400 [Plakobranchus ocellatus]
MRVFWPSPGRESVAGSNPRLKCAWSARQLLCHQRPRACYEEEKNKRFLRKTKTTRDRSNGGTGDSEPALRSAGTLLLRVRTPPLAPWPGGGPESLGSPCCGQAITYN